MTPRATVRLQLTRDFGFDAAHACIDYYAALGISHFYLSPIFRARSGSTHGYDAVDFHHISDELGGAPALLRLASALRERSMGIILDIVPNHMGIAGNENPWWNDVLARGRDSAFAGHFDIDWEPERADLRGKVLLPFLDRPLADALAADRLGLVREEHGGGLCVGDGHSRWPLSTASIAELAHDASAITARNATGRKLLQALLERQHYRLDDWRTAATSINWRRFFDVSDLAALRVEHKRVFDDVHKEIFALFQSGVIDGVRIDHVDGLAFPLDYCRRLRDAFEQRRPLRPPRLRDAPAWIVVEKVFSAHEPQRDWGVAGTTGYDFMDQASALLHNPAGQGPLDMLWRRISGTPWEFRSAVTQARRQVLEEFFGADLDRVVRAFRKLAATSSAAAHLASPALRRALSELIVAFPVYRSYGLPGALAPEDAAVLATALERAYRKLDPADYEALDFVARSLSEAAGAQAETPLPTDHQTDAATLQPEAALRFQLLTTPIAAKAIEDTVFYREARLLSRNEVGSDPNVFSIGLDEFHAACAVRAHRFPHGLLATATHDHKRGEDVRARLAALSDAAESWTQAVERWTAMNAPLRGVVGGAPAPDPVDEFMLYQTLVGAWPLQPLEDASRTDFWQRISRWWLKSMREAKRRTNWIAHNDAYEEASLRFLAGLIDGAGHNAFERDVGAFVDTIAAAGALNGLVQAFLRLTTPGIPDLYQGCEWWDLSLVDPDNRRPVDHAARAIALARPGTIIDALPAWRDGVVKQRLLARLLAHRRDRQVFYSGADHQPLTVAGARAAHVIAYERRSAHGRLVGIAARWPLSLCGGTLPLPQVPPGAWQDTRLELPQAGAFLDVLRGEPAALDAVVPLAEALRDLPVALYFAEDT